ncbi:MAG: FtsX-like permease family protein [Planctomycetota bacterium]|nr:FtsX-like permease family protein [Planctomycetota bacterium]
MTVWTLASREIRHRKLNFALSVFAVVVAVACLVGADALLRAHDRRTESLVAAKEAQTKKEMASLEEDYRKITIGLGFNVMILPKDQALGDFYSDDFAARTMPESYVQKLGSANLITVQHVAPSLQQKVEWPEQHRTILLVGTRGEIPSTAEGKKPIQPSVPAGSIVLGHELHANAGLKVGDTVELKGRTFKIAKTFDPRGNKDDITAWVPLKDAQEILDKPGQINGILALQCKCAWGDLPKVREEIAKILPDTQVIEFRSQALARAESRKRAERQAEQSVEDEKAIRANLRHERESVAGLLTPLSMLGCGVWVGLLAWANVRDRRGEIGILRTLGLKARQVLGLFLARAVLIGCLGAAGGIVVGAGVGMLLAEPAQAESPDAAGSATSAPATAPSAHAMPALPSVDPSILLAAVLLAPALAVVASWVPALLASRQDPADTLREA